MINIWVVVVVLILGVLIAFLLTLILQALLRVHRSMKQSQDGLENLILRSTAEVIRAIEALHRSNGGDGHGR
jgi:RsiW-degrading membrane proteinase PrsW (M82 family)